MYEALRENLGQGGTFDYQREKDGQGEPKILSQFREVANFNVGLFCQQAGFPLWQTLALAGAYAIKNSSNAKPRNIPYFLDDPNEYYIKKGWEAGEGGTFGPKAKP